MLLSFLLPCCILLSSQCITLTLETKLLFLSLDGFRWDFVNLYKEQLPNIRELASEGVMVNNGLLNNWVTNTFPSHRSLLTGMYDESHGIMGNTFYAPEFDDTFNKYKVDIKFWNWTEPIWKVAQDQGVTSACISMPGCDVLEQRPAHAVGFSIDYSFSNLIDQAIGMFSLKEDPAQAVFFYFWQPDRTGHEYGPISSEMKETLLDVDKQIGYLVSQLNSMDNESIDFILTADHGLTPINHIIVIDYYVNETVAQIVINRGSNVHIWPNDDEAPLMKAVELLKKNSSKGFQMFRRGEIPERYHYKHSIRSPPIMLIAEPDYEFVDSKYLGKGLKLGGGHGFDPERSDMHPIFIAKGPSFKSGYVHESPKMQLVDVYPLIAKLLNISPGPNNGSLTAASHLLQTKNLGFILTKMNIWIMLTVLIIHCVVFH